MSTKPVIVRWVFYVALIGVAVILVIYFTGGNRLQQLEYGLHSGLMIACELDPSASQDSDRDREDIANSEIDRYLCTVSQPNTNVSRTLNVSNEEAVVMNLTYIACQFQQKVLIADVTVNESEPDFIDPDTFRCIDESRLLLSD